MYFDKSGHYSEVYNEVYNTGRHADPSPGWAQRSNCYLVPKLRKDQRCPSYIHGTFKMDGLHIQILLLRQSYGYYVKLLTHASYYDVLITLTSNFKTLRVQISNKYPTNII